MAPVVLKNLVSAEITVKRCPIFSLWGVYPAFLKGHAELLPFVNSLRPSALPFGNIANMQKRVEMGVLRAVGRENPHEIATGISFTFVA